MAADAVPAAKSRDRARRSVDRLAVGPAHQNKNDLSSPSFGNGLERAGEILAERGTTCTRQRQIGEVIFEYQARHQVLQQRHLVIGRGSERDKVVGDALTTSLLTGLLLHQAGDDAALALSGLPGDRQVAAGGQQFVDLAADLGQF